MKHFHGTNLFRRNNAIYRATVKQENFAKLTNSQYFLLHLRSLKIVRFSIRKLRTSTMLKLSAREIPSAVKS